VLSKESHKRKESHECDEWNWVKLETPSEVASISAFPVLGVLTEIIKPGLYDLAAMAVCKRNHFSRPPALLLF